MSAEFVGVQVEELDSTLRYNPRTGDVRIRHWQGEPNQIATIETQARLLKYVYYTGWNGGYKTISVEYPESEANDPSTPLSEKWEADSNYLQKDLWTLPSVQAELQKIGGRLPTGSPLVQYSASESPDARAIWRYDFDAIANGREVTVQRLDSEGAPIEGEETTVTLPMLLDVALLYGADIEVFLKLARDISKGVTTWEVEASVAIHTQVTNRSSQIKASRDNIGKIHTANYITSRLPEDVKFELPEDGYWLKRKPNVREIEKGKWEIVQEWWHADSYSDLTYPDDPIA